MRGFIQFCTAAICMGLVGGGLFMSLHVPEEGVTISTPDTPGRLSAGGSEAIAFYEMSDSSMELTVLFSEQDDPESVFRTRVSLMPGQSHSIVVSEADDGSGAQRFTFKRDGDAVRMSRMDLPARAASFEFD